MREAISIEERPGAGGVVVEVRGRLDAAGAVSADAFLEAVVRRGHREVMLDLGGVDYVSSAGLRLLVMHGRRLQGAQGSLRVVAASGPVREVVDLAGLGEFLAVRGALDKPGFTHPCRREAFGDWVMEWRVERPEGRMTGRWAGDPVAMREGRPPRMGGERLRCERDTLAVGIGAFGRDALEASGRMGELWMAAGQAVTMPTDGSGIPDHQGCQGQWVPEVELLHGVVAKGEWAASAGVEACGASGGVGMGRVLEGVMASGGWDAMAFLMVGEARRVVGATLRLPPRAGGEPLTAFPGIRERLSWVVEGGAEGMVLLAAGFVASRPVAGGDGHLFGMGGLRGHVHAVALPYRPLPRQAKDAGVAVADLLGTGVGRTVLHLVVDDRPVDGEGETEWLRGTCWAAPWVQGPMKGLGA